jgi:speckle-type POZ protein
MAPWVVETSAAVTATAAGAPRPNLLQDFSKLLETKVGGREFSAHASVLAAWSSVLRAKLSAAGEPADAQQRHVAIDDTDPAVFEALLQFIYTDSVSASMAGLDADEKNDLCERLLVAADRYNVKGLKFVCGRTLSDGLDAETVASLLVLAVQHKCNVLRDACVQFIAGTDRLRDVVSSDGYGHLKESCPSVFVDLFEKAAMLCSLRETEPSPREILSAKSSSLRVKK